MVDKYIVIIVNINFAIFCFVANNTFVVVLFYFFQPLKSSYSLVTKGRSGFGDSQAYIVWGILFLEKEPNITSMKVLLACRLIHL